MRRFIFAICLTNLLLFGHAAGQTDDIRAATGLPIAIGTPVIYGQVSLRGLASGDPKPTIFVSLQVGGVQLDRIQTNDQGYYYFLRTPANGMTLLFEVNNAEAGRVILSAGTGSSVRQDISIDWKSAVEAQRPGIISVKSAYARGPEADKAFEKAMEAARAKKNAEAIELFKKIVEKDPKDFVAWTEMGTLYFGNSKLADAESSYQKALDQKPDFMAALMNLGKVYLGQKELDKAIAVFYKAVSTDQTSADAFHYLGEAYLQAKQGSKAVIALNEAIRLAPVENAEIHLRLATLYIAAGAKDRAANEYKMFLAKVPNYAGKDKLEKFIADNSH